MKVKIHLETLSDAAKFSAIAEKFDFNVKIKDGSGNCVNAKSVMGAIYSLEFSELWCESDEDIYFAIQDFVAK